MNNLAQLIEIGKNIWEPIRYINSINSVGGNMQNLKRKMLELSTQEEDINTELRNTEHQPGKRQKKVVGDWLGDVQNIKDDVERLDRERHIVFSRPWWQNVFSRPRLGKNIVEKTREVVELQEKGKVFNGLVIDVLPTCGRFIPSVKYVDGSTSAKNMEKVLECLMKDEVQKIGVFGMGGAGKTTLMHHINNQLVEGTCNVSNVIWATVSKAFDIRNLQGEIAKVLHLDLSQYDDETTRASLLHARLSQQERYVLILDDLWEDFPLEKVGIPEPTSSNECKLVLTTRSLEVCTKMDCRPLKVDLLTEEEALDLFMSKAFGNETVLARGVREIAIEVAKECKCLPLAIVIVAGSMKGVNNVREWRNALNDLISSTKEVSNDVDELFERLKFSYTRLRDEVLQKCFLYCALYPEDHDIVVEELIRYWIAEGLIDVMDRIEAKFDKGYAILGKLTRTCLLESSTDAKERNCIRMHDLIRGMALRITSSPRRFMVKAGEGLNRVLYEDWSEDLERVSLMHNRIQELPSRPPICPRLTTLLLNGNYNLAVILDSFFTNMPRLEVLDLSFAGIQSLPESISNLENLHALLLKSCKMLKNVPPLGKLKALKELKLTDSKIREVPRDIEKLVNLEILDLSHNIHVEMIPDSFFTNMPRLEVLDLSHTCIQSLPESISNLENLHALLLESCHGLNNLPSLGKLKALKELKLAKCHIREVPQGIEELVNLEKLDLSFNHDLLMFPSWKLRRLSKLQYLAIHGTSLEVSVEELLRLTKLKFLGARFHNVEELRRYLTSQYGQGLEKYRLTVGPNNHFVHQDGGIMITQASISIARVPFQSGVDKLVLPSSIDKFQLCECHDLISLSAIPSLRDARDLWLQTVESICLDDLPSCRVLFDRIVPPHTVSFNLTTLDLWRCPSIKYIFPAQLAQNFPNLEVLNVSHCEHLENIIEKVETSDWGHRQESNAITLPKLRSLSLWNLPRLESIYTGTMVCESLGTIWVERCPSMKYIFPAQLVQNFPNLEKLEVWDCERLENIIEKVETSDWGHRQESNAITLPKLESLSLHELPRLKSIYMGTMVCESLEEIWVYRCPMLRRLPISLHMDSEQRVTAPPALKSIDCEEEEWWESLEWDDPRTKAILQPFLYRDESESDSELSSDNAEDDSEDDSAGDEE